MNRGAVVETCRPKDSPGRTLTLSAKPSMAPAGPALVTCQSAFPGRAFSALTSKPCAPSLSGEPDGFGLLPVPAPSAPPVFAASVFPQPVTAASPAAVAAAPVAMTRNRRLPAPVPSAPSRPSPSPVLCS